MGILPPGARPRPSCAQVVRQSWTREIVRPVLSCPVWPDGLPHVVLPQTTLIRRVFVGFVSVPRPLVWNVGERALYDFLINACVPQVSRKVFCHHWKPPLTRHSLIRERTSD